MESFPRGTGKGTTGSRSEGGGGGGNSKGEERSKSRSDTRKRRDKDAPTSTNKKRPPAADAAADDDVLFGAKKPGEGHGDNNSNNKARSNKKARKIGSGPAKANEISAGGTGGAASSSSSSSLLPVGGGGVVQPARGEPWIESLSFGKLGKGMKVLAVVREVHDDVVVFSLPNLWTGFYLRKSPDKDPPCHRLVAVGQYLSVTILKAVQETTKEGPKRRIQVCFRPGSVNPTPDVMFPSAAAASSEKGHQPHQQAARQVVRGQVQSIQDHGAVFDLGHGQRGFLHFADIEGEYDVLDDDDDDEEEDMDLEEGEGGADGRRRHRQFDLSKPILNVGRVMDVVVTPTPQQAQPTNSTSSSQNKKKGGADKDSTSPAVLSLALPGRHGLARQFVTYTPVWEALQPGMLVHVSVERVVKNGVCVAFAKNGMYRGAIEVQHLSGSGYLPDWQSVFREVRVLAARLVVVDPSTKWIRLSLQPHVLDYSVPSAFPRVGSVVKGAEVVRLDSGVGALLALPSDSQHSAADSSGNHHKGKLNADLWKLEEYQKASQLQTVYVHISKAVDSGDSSSKGKTNKAGGKQQRTPEGIFHSSFSPGAVHDVRILSSSNWMDGIASGATAASVVAAHVLTHADLKPGKVYKQVPVVQVVQSKLSSSSHVGAAKQSVPCSGVLVDFGMGVRGFIPANQMFDAVTSATNSTGTSSHFRAKLMQSMYAVGAKVNVRVLSVHDKRCMLTAKKAIVQAPDDQIIISYEGIKVGQRAVGFVTRVVDDKNGGGIYVTFCNNVYGRVTAKCLESELGVDKAKENYQLGDAVVCRVTSVQKRPKKSSRGKPVGARRTSFDDEMDVDDDADKETGSFFWELTLSLKLDSSHTEEEVAEKVTPETASSEVLHLRAGSVLPLRSLRVVDLVNGRDKQGGGFVPGYAIVSIKTKYVVPEGDLSNLPEFIECKLPYDQLLDEYDTSTIQSASTLDQLAAKLLSPGKKVNRKGLVVTDPEKLLFEYTSGIGKLAVVSVRPRLIEVSETQPSEGKNEVVLPSLESQFFVGAMLVGYVAQVDHRHGAFVRFLNGLTGLVPKSKGGLELGLFRTVTTKVVALDVAKRPIQILLSVVAEKQRTQDRTPSADLPLKIGDVLHEVEVSSVDFHRVEVKVLDEKALQGKKYRARLHVSMAKSTSLRGPLRKAPVTASEQVLSTYHPFNGLAVGAKLKDLRVAAIDARKNTVYLDLTSLDNSGDSDVPLFVESTTDLSPDQQLSGIVTSIDSHRGGIYVQISPSVTGFIPGLELSKDPDILNNLSKHFVVGSRLDCAYVNRETWRKRFDSSHHKGKEAHVPFFSLLRLAERDDAKNSSMEKPMKGQLVVGRINRSLTQVLPPSLMLELRFGYAGRCCVCELEEHDEWRNLPFGTRAHPQDSKSVTGREPSSTSRRPSDSPYSTGMFVLCRVLEATTVKGVVDVSLRQSRIDGDLDEDDAPEIGDLAHAYVVDTNKKGCFLRLSRKVEGRATLKELCDSFLPDPAGSFPCGRLVVGKVKAVKPRGKGKGSSALPLKMSALADLDLRESVVSTRNKLKFEDVAVGSKLKGRVSRIEEYGVFVQLENSDLSGLTHKSECSDNYIKSLSSLYEPGDLVKVLVLKRDEENRKLGFSMKASHFENDPESDDESEGSIDDDEIAHAEDDEIVSDDENYVKKLASRLNNDAESGDNESSDSGSNKAGESDSNSASSSHSSSDAEDVEDSDDDGDDTSVDVNRPESRDMMDTNVGFDWGGAAPSSKAEEDVAQDSETDSDESVSSAEAEDSGDRKRTHKSRRKHAQRMREEEELVRREMALADGTADENPETADDFERQLVSSPNSSELWIKYMAFHLTTANIEGAKKVAERAFERISFRQEGERLNVWCAFMTLELKYGSEEGLQRAVERACQHNNPKHVYLRVCEMLEKEAAASSFSADSVQRADEMFQRMCKKFKSKKKVWLAHVEFLLKTNRADEAFALSKKALLSLPPYKHVETMTKVASLVFEFGNQERGRSLFEGLLIKYPKRLDLFFVFVDKEVKYGDVSRARALFEQQASIDPAREGTVKMKLSDKQMKSMFKKWYAFEESNGTDTLRERVKAAARAYVENSM